MLPITILYIEFSSLLSLIVEIFRRSWNNPGRWEEKHRTLILFEELNMFPQFAGHVLDPYFSVDDIILQTHWKPQSVIHAMEDSPFLISTWGWCLCHSRLNKGTPPWGGRVFSTIVYLRIKSKTTILHGIYRVLCFLCTKFRYLLEDVQMQKQLCKR